MNSPHHLTMRDESAAAELLAMMEAFYRELDVDADMSRFPETIRYFLAHPDNGRIILIYNGGALAGYALLIQFWSNEYGGPIMLIDELYVKPDFRRQGLARQLFQALKEQRLWEARAMMLEVAHSNRAARRFYEAFGFTEKPNALMAYPLDN